MKVEVGAPVLLNRVAVSFDKVCNVYSSFSVQGASMTVIRSGVVSCIYIVFSELRYRPLKITSNP